MFLVQSFHAFWSNTPGHTLGLDEISKKKKALKIEIYRCSFATDDDRKVNFCLIISGVNFINCAAPCLFCRSFLDRKKNLSRLYKFFFVCRKLVQTAHFFLCVQFTICFLDKKKLKRLEKTVLDIYRFWILPFWAPTSVRWVATFYLIHFLEKKYKKTAIGAVEGRIQNLHSLKCKLYNFFFVCKKLVQIVQIFCTEKKLVQIG